MPGDVESNVNAHSVAEVWIEQFKKWVLADGQYGGIAELKGVPLNGVELQRALAEEQPVNCRVCTSRCGGWKQFIAPNMYYFKIVDDQRPWWSAGVFRQLVPVPKGAPPSCEPHRGKRGSIRQRDIHFESLHFLSSSKTKSDTGPQSGFFTICNNFVNPLYN